MGWRSIIISNPAQLSFAQSALRIVQNVNLTQQVAQIPLEDISVLVIDHPRVSLTACLLSALADAQVTVITVNSAHLPNGMLLPYLPHSRALKIMQAQLDLSLPKKKRLWQSIIKQKILNQAAVLASYQKTNAAHRILALSKRVRPGDPENFEAQAARIYFPHLFGKNFFRSQDRFYNAALNYGYAVIRAAIARTLCSYGFLPAFGLFHHNELNSFNLVDDLLEPYRPLVDAHVYDFYPQEPFELENESYILKPQDKARLTQLLHHDITLNGHAGENAACTLLAGIEANVISLSKLIQSIRQKPEMIQENLVMPCLDFSLSNG